MAAPHANFTSNSPERNPSRNLEGHLDRTEHDGVAIGQQLFAFYPNSVQFGAVRAAEVANRPAVRPSSELHVLTAHIGVTNRDGATTLSPDDDSLGIEYVTCSVSQDDRRRDDFRGRHGRRRKRRHDDGFTSFRAGRHGLFGRQDHRGHDRDVPGFDFGIALQHHDDRLGETVGLAFTVLGDRLGEFPGEVPLHIVKGGTITRMQEHGVGVGNAAGVLCSLGIDDTEESPTHLDGANRRVVHA